MADESISSLGLRSVITANGELIVTLEQTTIGDLLPDEIVIRVEASPMNPTDIGLLWGPADLSRMVAFSHDGRPGVRAPIPAEHMASLKSRIGKSMPVGFEGAGTVIRAGADAVDLLGKTVSAMSGAMYERFRRVKAGECMVLPAGTSARAAASMYVNPLTALSMVEVMRNEGHRALVHTAAASNLGRMLVRICIDDGIPLVNIVRSDEQVKALRSLGAEHVVNSNDPSFFGDLTTAIAATGATLAFDAVSGGLLADSILRAMEEASGAAQTAFNRYGTSTSKQLYIYGSLDPEPTVLSRAYGSSWAVARFFMLSFLQKAGDDTVLALKNRIVRELSTTFASSYKDTLSLNDVVDPDFVRQYARKSTGSKFLVNPSLLRAGASS